MHPDIYSRYDRLKFRDHIKQTQNKWKVSELLAKRMGKGLHKLFKAVVD